jgi:hypothetical protein
MKDEGCALSRGRSLQPRREELSASTRELMASDAQDDVTEAIDRVVADVGDGSDPFATAAATRVLERCDW